MSISRKLRFEIFKRDNFTCGYCGQQPPEVILEIDHILPVSKGGDDDINNLLTSCFDCNRGKTNIKLDQITPQIKENLEVLKIKEEQIKEYRKYVKNYRKRITREINEVEKIFVNYFENYGLTDRFKISIKQFLKHLPIDVVLDNMDSACCKFDDPGRAIKYFCGICWNNIRGVKW